MHIRFDIMSIVYARLFLCKFGQKCSRRIPLCCKYGIAYLKFYSDEFCEQLL